MKKICFLIGLVFLFTISFAQTNTFPSSGNVGIGTANPNGKLDVNGAILLPGSSTNTMLRPGVGVARITGEIAGYREADLAYDDGFLRLSAGGGTSSSSKTFIDLSGYSTVPDMDRNITLGTAGMERMRISNTGNVGIGTSAPQEALSVNGNIRSKQIKVEIANWPDYVFKPEYNLQSLQDVKSYIDQNQHLPDMPSAYQVAKDGLNLGEMNKLLTKKVEELTLYLIEKDDKDKQKDVQLNLQQDQLFSQQEQINLLKKQLDIVVKVLNKN